jgi:methionyl-tRNA synthetase
VDDADAVDLAGYHTAMDGTRGYLLHDALAHLWRTVARANEYVQSSAPWALSKDPARRGELEVVLATLVRQLARQAVCVAPFMPGKAQELWLQLGGPQVVSAQRFGGIGALDVIGWRVRKGEALFPKEAPAKTTA